MPLAARRARVGAGRDGEVERGRRAPPSFASLAELAVLAAAAGALYLALTFGVRGVPESVRAGVPFLALPVSVILLRKRPLALGAIDRTFALSAAAYAPFAVAAAAAAPFVPSYYARLAALVAGPALAVIWAVDTFFHVGTVDFFTRRVAHCEAEARWGPSRALAISFAVWCGAHVVEWFWLRGIFGEVGAAVYLGAAGVVTGFAYLRWRNVLGLMFGHLLVNAAAAGAAVAVYG